MLHISSQHFSVVRRFALVFLFIITAGVMSAAPALADTWYRDADGDGWGDDFDTVNDTICPPGYVAQGGDCNDNYIHTYPGAPEICDGNDNDCDMVIDNDCVYLCYPDVDGDGFGDCDLAEYHSIVPEGYVGMCGDCDDNDPTVFDIACEICDGKDNNCNGETDENCGPVWYYDADLDGYGVWNNFICDPEQVNEYWADFGGDCNDYDAYVHPNAPEICNGADNNCNGIIDDGAQVVWYQDLDNDFFGTHADTILACEYAGPEGYALQDGDCDDYNPDINPEMSELCNGTDDNCNDIIDEAPTDDGLFEYFRDLDGDGFGVEGWHFCHEMDPIPEGFSAIDGDCDDTNPDVNPDSEEICDHADNNCNGEVDEGVSVIWYPDLDQDGYGINNLQYVQVLCEGEDPQYPEYCCLNDLDCDDNDPDIHPGVVDINDWVDNDCDGLIDEDADTIAMLPITDVGNDQGRFVRVRWTRHLMDQPGAPETINMYSLYRRIDEGMKSSGHEIVPPEVNSPPGDWDWVATVPASGENIYSLVAHTLCDSTDTGIGWSVFFVRSHTPDQFTFYDTPVDSGYSIDNLFPEAPQNLMATFNVDNVALQWSPTEASDLRCYRVYRGLGDYPLDESHLATSTTETSWTDETAGADGLTFRVTTVDLNGNESYAAEASAVSAVDNPQVPEVWSLSDPVPNPFNPMTSFTFTIPGEGSQVSLRIYDLAGRVVKTLVQDYMEAGTHDVVWRGMGDDGRLAAAGVYFARLEGQGFNATRRMMLVK